MRGRTATRGRGRKKSNTKGTNCDEAEAKELANLQSFNLKLLREGRSLRMNENNELEIKVLDGDDALKYVNHPTFYDIELIVNGKAFHAHRKQLSKNSPFFRSMLQGQFRESTDDQINLELPDAEGFELILRYLYSSKLMEEVLSYENICSVLQNADYLNLKKLYDYVFQQFVVMEPTTVRDKVKNLDMVMDSAFMTKLLRKLKNPKAELVIEWLGLLVDVNKWDLEKHLDQRKSIKTLCSKYKVFSGLTTPLYTKYLKLRGAESIMQLYSSVE